MAFEEAHRLCDTLEDLLSLLGNRRLVVARDLTRHGEEFYRGRVGPQLAYFSAHRPRGDVTLVVEGRLWRDTDPEGLQGCLERVRGLALAVPVPPNATAQVLPAAVETLLVQL